MMNAMSTTNQTILWEEKNSTKPENNCLNNKDNEQKDIINDTNNVSTKNPCNYIGKISGIYKIVNKVNGKYYVGSSNDVCGKFGRWYEHRKKLINNTHVNEYLQNAWNKYGEFSFDFLIIEQCKTNQLLSIEQKYLDIAKNEKQKCYNLSFKSSVPEMNDQTKLKISIKMKHVCSTIDYRNDMSQRVLGTKNPFYGKHHTDDTKKLLSVRSSGKKIGAKKVKQIDLKTNEVIKVWESAVSAHKYFSSSTSKKSGGHIGSVCNGRLKSAHGYKWKWYEQE